MTLPRSFLDELRDRVTLSDIVGKKLRLIRAGREFKGCCPFHKEKTPSFTLNDQKGFYHCFGCGAHGDALRFLMEHDNMGFMEAVEQLAGMAGLQVPRQSPEEMQRYEKRKSLYDLVDAAAQWFEAQLRLPGARGAMDYLLKRGLSEPVLKSFRLGFAPGSESALREYLTGKGFVIPDMVAVGLLRESDRGSAPFSFFRDRIIFPVTDARGRIVAFGGRVLPQEGPPSMSGHAPPKYINSPDTDLFHKGGLLYNLAAARVAATKGKPIVLAEGYMDVIALSAAGFTGAVAPLGTALTEAQIAEMWRIAPEDDKAPVLCFDGDTAGQRAAARALDRVLPLLKPDHTVRFAFLPQGQDPDSLIRARGVPAMQEVLDQSASLADMLWRTEMEGRRLDAPEARAGFKQSLEQRVRQIAHRDVQAFYQQEIRKRLDQFFAAPRMGAGSGRNNNRVMSPRRFVQEHIYQPFKTRVARPGAKGHVFARERILLLATLNHPALFDEFGEAVGMLDLPAGSLNDLRDALLDILSAESGHDAQTLRVSLENKGFSGALQALGMGLDLHLGFARPDQPAETVRQGFQESWERSRQKGESA